MKIMKRNTFLATLVSAIAVPMVACQKVVDTTKRLLKGFKINADEGRIHGHIQLKGVNANMIDIKVSGKDTNGDLLFFEQTSLSQGKGTPLHVHHFQDEIFRVIEGEYQFQVGEDKFHLTVGDSIFLPRKVPHAWTQVAEKGKLLVILQPAGKLEAFFVTMSALKSEPTKAEIDKIFADNEMEVVGPPLKLE